MSKIKIKNFGPIKEGYKENDGWLDIEKVTLFIGNQASGKSTIAKLISTFTWLEKALYRYIVDEDTVIKEFKENFCDYFRIKNYFRHNWFPEPKDHAQYKEWMQSQSIPDSEIHFIGSKFEFHYFEYELKITPVPQNNEYYVPKIIYVPAERNFVSSIERPDKVVNFPAPWYEFLYEYRASLEELTESLDLPISNLKLYYRKETKTAHIIVENNNIIRLLEASSGLQSSIPLYLVSRNLASSIGKESDTSKKNISLDSELKLNEEKLKIIQDQKLSEEQKNVKSKELDSRFINDCFINIVEEPEQNLFPSSQRQMLNSLLEFNNMNIGNELIITTHSPYLINFLSIAIQGNELYKKIQEKGQWENLKEKFEKIVPEKSIISASDVVIYQLDEDKGTIMKLPSPEGIPSDRNYLNQSLAEGNQLFDALLEIEQGL